MSRQSTTRVALLMIALTTLSGCSPTQPFYFHEDGDLSHLLNQATEIEYADVDAPPLPDAALSESPLRVSDSEFREIWDLSLEECLTIALQNSKNIRRLTDLIATGFFGQSTVSGVGGSGSIYDPALTEVGGSSFSQATSDVTNRRRNFLPTANNVGGVESALAEFDAVLDIFGSAGGNSAGGLLKGVSGLAQADKPESVVEGNRAVQSTAGGLTTGLSKKIATGGQVSFANRTDYDRNNLLGTNADVRSEWTTQFEMRFDHPLLEGRGTLINRIPILLARMNTDISVTQFEANIRNMCSDIENAYWDLHQRYRELETAKAGRDSAQLTWKHTYVKWDEGVETVQAEAQAREQYFAFRARIEQSLQGLYDFESRLRYLMGLSASDGRLIRPIDEPTLARVEFDWPAIRTETLVRSPELRQVDWRRKQLELELMAAKNRLLPKLDAGVLYRWIGRGDDLINTDSDTPAYPAAGSTAFEELTQGNYQEAAFFLNFQMPVGFRKELAQVRNIQLQIARQEAQIEDFQLQQIHLLSTSIRRLDASYAQAQSHFNRWSASETQVDSATVLWEKGAKGGTVDLVLDAQRRRAEAQQAYYASLVDYNKAIAEIHFRKGSLLEYNNIQLAEGPWPHKAYWDALGRARERNASSYLNYGYTRPSVVSRGPVTQHTGVSEGTTTSAVEIVPTPKPTLADPLDGDDLTPDDLPRPESMPTAELPTSPMLNAPVVHTADASSVGDLPNNPLRGQSSELRSISLAPVRSGTASDDVLPMVRQAAFTGSVSDAR